MKYFLDFKKYGLTLSLTPSILYLTGGLLGIYFKNDSTMLFESVAVIGGLPILFSLIALKFNLLGALLLIIDSLLVLYAIYAEGVNYVLLALLFLSYNLPLIISGVLFSIYWYKNKTRL
ncbi:MAG: hypothetical protein QME45_06405 [Clostridiales bacterium]|nr:hypothetical protein [Clostridiales bacterium]HBM80784.1 hypothetical protein [Clostridiaceae bacterium]